MQVAATMFNACVLQTLLYGSPICGGDFLSSWDWLKNPFQEMHARTLKPILHLPPSTAHVIIMLESGMYPVMFYAAKSLLNKIGEPCMFTYLVTPVKIGPPWGGHALTCQVTHGYPLTCGDHPALPLILAGGALLIPRALPTQRPT